MYPKLSPNNGYRWCPLVKLSHLGLEQLSDISEKQSIVYTSAFIEEARIGSSISHTDTNNVSHSHTWNDEDQAFDYKLDQ